MNRITAITRKEVFDVLTNKRTEYNFLGNPLLFNFWGILMPDEFLGRLYNLEQIPAKDNQYKNAKEELETWRYGIPKNLTWDWIFHDERFPLKAGSDEELLDFICTVLHPEVRDENVQDFGQPIWENVWQKVNVIVANDGYSITCDGTISNHMVYSWIDLTKQSLRTINMQNLSPFVNLFARNGKILNLDASGFRDFTKQIIDIELVPVYVNSQTKSFTQFLNEGNDEDVKILLAKLFEYYENNDLFENERSKDSRYFNLYKICKKHLSKFKIANTVIESYTKELALKFSSEYITHQSNLMVKMQKKNPTEAIGKAKELIESCCTTILEERQTPIDEEWSVQQLVKATMKILRLTPEDIAEDATEAKAIKGLLGNLSVISQNIATLRNKYGSGHGKSAHFRGLEERHAKLAIGSSVTLVDFLWTSHKMDSDYGQH